MIKIKLEPSLTSYSEPISERALLVSSSTDTTDIDDLKPKQSHVGPSLYEEYAYSTSTSKGIVKNINESCLSFRKQRYISTYSFLTQASESPSKKTSELKAEIESLKSAIYSYEHNGQGKFASFYAVFFVESSFRHRDYKKINELLSDIDINNVTEWSLVALLRSSFSARDYLPAWPKLLSAAKKKLDDEGKDTRRYLRGLTR